jgi:hypothetical protein
LAAACFVGAGVCGPCCGQEPSTSGAAVAAVPRDARFATPQAAIHHFRQAVRQRRWRDEYDCYSDQRQARFAFFIVVCVREMRDAEDLAAKAELAFQKFGLPADVLDRFPSLQSVRFGPQDPQQIERERREFDRARERQLQAWTNEAYARNVDWGALIEELQPLYVANFGRHEGELLHPSQSGIVTHLNYHTYGPVTDLIIDGDRAEGTIVACVRDPQVIVEEQAAIDDPQGGPWWLPRGFPWRDRVLSAAGHRSSRRPPQTIALVRRDDCWKIDAAPFR